MYYIASMYTNKTVYRLFMNYSCQKNYILLYYTNIASKHTIKMMCISGILLCTLMEYSCLITYSYTLHTA